MSEWKETEFGRIPSQWDLKTVDEIKSKDKYSVSMGPFGSNIKVENFVEDGVPVIRGSNLNFDRYVNGDFAYVTDKKANELISSNCKPGDLVFTHRGTIGQVGIIPFNSRYIRYIISQSGMKLTVDASIIDPMFTFYFFKSKFGQFQLLKNESQVGVPSISTPLTSLKEIEVPLPPLPEQKAIASVLSSLDDKIELLQKQNETLEKMAAIIFKNWFVDTIDENFTKGILNDILDLIYGKGLKQSERSFGKFPVVGSSGIVNYNNTYLVESPGIVIGRKGTLGKVNYLFDNFFPIDTTFYVKAKRKNSSLIFEYFLLKSLNFSEMNTDSAVPGLNRNIALATEIKVPPKEKIILFENITASFFKKIYQNNKQLNKLSKLRDSLLPKLMSGEVRVRT